jgi:hypothetical protein
MALAESVVADEELMAVVEPVHPHVSVDQIRGDIAAARLAVEVDDEPDFIGDEYLPANEHEETRVAEPTPPPTPAQVRAGFAHIAARLTSG